MSESKTAPVNPSDRKTWETPALKTVGSMSELLQSGGGKPSTSTADPGEPRKTKNQSE